MHLQWAGSWRDHIQAAKGCARMLAGVYQDMFISYNLYLNHGCGINSVPAIYRELTPGFARENSNTGRLARYFLIHENDYIQVMAGWE